MPPRRVYPSWSADPGELLGGPFKYENGTAPTVLGDLTIMKKESTTMKMSTIIPFSHIRDRIKRVRFYSNLRQQV